MASVESSWQHKKLKDLLSPIDFAPHQQHIISQRQIGTARWFLESTKFKEWLRGPEKVLFCLGLPGAGKTMMAAVTVDHLRQVSVATYTGIAYISCGYKSQED